jgi:hypothetical protein
MSKTLAGASSNQGFSGQFAKGDPMKVKRSDGTNIKNFPLPRPAGDGSCDLNSGPSFLSDLSGETCSLRIQNFEQACSNGGSLSTQIWDNLRFLRGSSNFNAAD